MFKSLLPALALAGVLIPLQARAAAFAEAVVDYQPGTGYSAGYISPDTALGPPTQADSFGTPVDPFNGPWQTNHLVSIGAGGHLTVRFGTPILNAPAHPWGRDFIIYGNTMFVDSDWPNGRTDENATLFGQNSGQTRVSVSADGIHFYQLNPALAPVVDGLYPTDAQGTPGLPVNPALGPAAFANQTMAQIRGLYAGSAGGTSFDLAWAQDELGRPVDLPSVSFVRVDVLSGASEIDAFAAVPAGFGEDFAGPPLERGWRLAGDSSLFLWDATNQALQVTWNSSRTNSYFYRPLGTILSQSDDFSFAFDLRLSDITNGTTPGKPYTFEIAVGLMNSRSITNPSFARGAGQNLVSGPRNLVEFDYFPDAGLGATFATTVVSTNNRFAYANNFPLPWAMESLFHVVVTYAASNQTLRTVVTRDGQPFSLPGTNALKEVVLTNTPDFRVDSFAISSYSDAGQPAGFVGSVLAHGVLDNVTVVTPSPPAANVAGRFGEAGWQIGLAGRTNWLFALEGTTNLVTWTMVSPWVAGVEGAMVLAETNPVPRRAAFYRVVADKP